MRKLRDIVDICQLLLAIHFACSGYLPVYLESQPKPDLVPVFVRPENVDYIRLTQKALNNV